MGVWTAGGTSVPGGINDTRLFLAGLRIGRVMTGAHGPGFLRGQMEVVADLVPVYVVFQGRTVYGAAITPPMFKWNFTSRKKKVVPYVEVGSGLLFSSGDVPAGTSFFNFTPQVGAGMLVFTREKRAWSLAARYLHHSNSSLAGRNPGINSVQFLVGYHWFK